MDGSQDSRFKTFSDLQQGVIQGVDRTYDNPLPLSQFISSGILVYQGHMRNVRVTDNLFVGLSNALYSSGSGRLDELTFSQNNVFDMQSSGLAIQGNAAVTADIEDNQFDIDPYFKGPNRGNVGNWGTDNTPALDLANNPNAGGIVKNNKIWNASDDINLDPTNPMSRWLIQDNIDFANPVQVNGFTNQNVGIGLIHTAGFKLILEDDNPYDSQWHQILSVPIEGAAAQPTTGFWMPGEFVKNSAPSSSNAALGWLRITLSNNGGYNGPKTSTNNVSGTDWIVK